MQILPLASLSWEFRDTAREFPWSPAIVPGCVHRDLYRQRRIPDPFRGQNEDALQWIEERKWEYRTAFVIPAELHAQTAVDLVADGLDTIATVMLNGHVVARTDNMFLGWRWNIKRLLQPGRNVLLVRLHRATEYVRTHRTGHRPRQFGDRIGGCTRIRKQQCQFGWDWGPRFVTAGIWRDVRLEGWTDNRLKQVRVTQQHQRGRVTLHLDPELAVPDATAQCLWQLHLDDQLVQKGVGREIQVERPQLWWPNGQGQQPLYTLALQLVRADGRPIGEWRRRIGLRMIELDRHADRWGESFQFVVNGRPVFAKGANWIPAHSFVAGLSRDDYRRDLLNAAEANMNMIRVWGGGIYESDDFYDLCDELGLMVWQDFMFACTQYPADRAFLASVEQEAAYQIRRLRDRACLALWCGNNEIFHCNPQDLTKHRKSRRDYEILFHRLLPKVVAREGAATAYWPTSPWVGDYDNTHAASARRGDTHFWDVWHRRNPVKDYEKYLFRFVSEFGMQSFNGSETQATFCPATDANVFGPTMTNHQKNPNGNQIILDYVSRRYRYPKDQESLLFLSQLNQAYCMQTGVEHWRRNMPRCMGALYWQLNDCWPVASWSSVEFTGRWKALHYLARRFFAPAMVSAHVPGDELSGIGNIRVSTIRHVHLYTVFDAPQPARGELQWDLFHLDGRMLQRGRKAVQLHPGTGKRQASLDLAWHVERHGRDNVYLRIALSLGGRRVSEETVFLSPPRFIALPRPRTAVKVRRLSNSKLALTFHSSAFQHRFAFDFPGQEYRATDNYFELYPREAKTVTVEFTRFRTVAEIRRGLKYRSLVDTY